MLKNILIWLLISTLTIANGKPTTTDRTIMNLSLNYEFEKADQLFAEQFAKTENLKKHFLFLNIELLKVIKATDEAHYKQRRAVKDSLNKILINYAENIIERYEDEELLLYDKFYFGSIHGLLGRLYGVTREMMSAFSSGKEGRNIMEDVIEEDPEFVDAYLLLGMMNYYADRLGGITEFVAGILGLSGDRNIGLKYLERVEKEGSINNWQATMILIELYSRMEGNKFASLPLLEKIVNRFPRNTKFKNWLCYEYLNLHQLNKLGNMILNDSDGAINDYIKASYYHQSGEYEKSNQVYNELLDGKKFSRSWVNEGSKFTRVMNYYYMGNDEKVKELSKNLNEEYSTQFHKIIQNPKLTNKVTELKRAVLFEEKSIVEKFIDDKPEFGTSNLEEARYYYYLGVHYFNNNNINNAEQYFLKSKELNSEEFGSATARYLINIYMTNTVEIEKVEKLMDDIDDLDNEGLEFFAQDLEDKYDL